MTDPAPSLVVSEIFGPTASGEGPTLGQRCAFLRLGGCDLDCSWCDTPYTWDGRRFDLRAEMHRTPTDDIVSRLLATGADFVIVSGGEPLLQQKYPGWEAVLSGLADAGVRIEVETNGTVAPTPASVTYLDRFTVSPKLAHSGIAVGRRINGLALQTLAATGKAVFKFVCRDAADVAEAADIAQEHGIAPDLVWVMPEGTSADAITGHLRAVADPALSAGFNLTTRLHVYAWGDERGR